MKVLALYTAMTLPLARRIIAPFSVLAERGHSYNFQSVIGFEASIAHAYDAIVLSDWILSANEMSQFRQSARERSYVYDLSDVNLLQDVYVQQTMRSCRMITVPNAFIQKEVQTIIRGVGSQTKVKVLPSTLDVDYYMQGRKYDTSRTGIKIGCFGNYDWYLIKDAIAEIKKDHPKVIFLGDGYAQVQLGDLVEVSHHKIETYPAALFSCTFGLCPIDGNRGIDDIVRQEYGILCKPTLYLGKSGDWVKGMTVLLEHETFRAEKGNYAYESAREYSVRKLAGEYLRTYDKNLPHIVGIV